MNDKSVKTLLIEADLDDVLLLKDALAEAVDIQFQVTHADRLAIGLEKLAEGGIDVVLLDLNLPDSHGLDTLTALHAQAPEVPVVVLTGLADEEMGIKALQDGAQGYLVKGRRDSNTLARELRSAMERHHWARELRASEARIHRLIEKNPDGILVVNQQRIIQYVNPAAEALFGRKAEEMIGETFGFPIAAGETTEQDIVRGPGETAVVEMRIMETDWEGEPCYLISLRDITERKRMEDALRHERDFAESLIETAQAIVLVLDTQGRIIRINRYMEEISGYRLEEVQGKDWFTTFLPKRDHGRIRELFLKSIGDIQTRGNTNPILTKDGRQREIEWYDKTLKDAEGNVVGLLAVGQDITERKQAEAAVRRYTEELTTLQETALDIITLHDLPTLLETIVDRATKLLDASGGELGLYDETTGDIQIAASHNLGQDYTGTRLALGEGAMGRAAQTRKPLIVEDYATWEGRLSQYVDGHWHGVMAVPLIFSNRLIGAISVFDSDPARRFIEEDLRILELFARQAAVAVENARLLAENTQHLEMLDTLNDGAQRLTTSLDKKEVAEEIVRNCVEAFGVKLAWLGRAEPDGSVRVLSRYPLDIDYLHHITVRWDDTPEGHGPAGKAIKEGKPQICNDIYFDPSFAPWKGNASEFGLRSAVALPLITRNRVFGALSLYSDKSGYFMPDRIQYLQSYAHLAANALENVRLLRRQTGGYREYRP